jgi:hypothetical protein
VKIPSSFAHTGGIFRSLRLRYSLRPDDRDAFEHRAGGLIASAGCATSDFRDYDLLGDLGGNRFVGDDRTSDRRERRAQLIVAYLQAVSELVLDAIRGPDTDGRYRVEVNDDEQNPHQSSFESMHHLFCNMTEVPTSALIWAGTHWNPPGPNPAAVRVRF